MKQRERSAKKPSDPAVGPVDPIPPLPDWTTPRLAAGPEDLAMQAGAVLAHIQTILARPNIPLSLLRHRLALKAATFCCAVTGRGEGTAVLRDEVHFLRPGDQPGPGGRIYLNWRNSIQRPISTRALHRALPDHEAKQITAWMHPDRTAQHHNPVATAARVLAAVLADAPRAEVSAFVLADAALSRAAGWSHVVPLLSVGAKPRLAGQGGEELRLASYRAVHTAALDLIPMAAELERRAVRLRVTLPRLRSKGAEKAADLLLSQDAISAGALTFLSDRSARRFCDRVVELGVVRELTGRDSYRLYGL